MRNGWLHTWHWGLHYFRDCEQAGACGWTPTNSRQEPGSLVVYILLQCFKLCGYTEQTRSGRRTPGRLLGSTYTDCSLQTQDSRENSQTVSKLQIFWDISKEAGKVCGCLIRGVHPLISAAVTSVCDSWFYMDSHHSSSKNKSFPFQFTQVDVFPCKHVCCLSSQTISLEIDLAW